MESKITFAVIIFVAVFLGFVAYQIYQTETSFNYGRYQTAITAENPNNKNSPLGAYLRTNQNPARIVGVGIAKQF